MKRLPFIILSLAALCVAACDQSTDSPALQSGSQSLNLTSTSQADSSSVTIVHGIPGADVDVFVNGNELLSNVSFGTITDPLTFEEGTYWIVIETTAGNDTVFADSVALPGNVNLALVAHLTETGTPTLTTFFNDMNAIVPGKGRLVLRHAAAAPAVDVHLYRGARLNNFFGMIDSLANTMQVQMDIRPGRYTATINSLGSSSVVFGPSTIQHRPHEAYILYAVGSLSNGTFTLLLQRMSLFHTQPPATR